MINPTERSHICQTDGGVSKHVLALKYAHRVLTENSAMKDSSTIMYKAFRTFFSCAN